MKPLSRGLIIFTIVLLVGGIVFIGYLLRARTQANEYLFQVDAVLSACMVANQGEPLTDADKAVIAEYDGQKAVVVPGNYAALSSYLRKDAVMPLLLQIDRRRRPQDALHNLYRRFARRAELDKGTDGKIRKIRHRLFPESRALDLGKLRSPQLRISGLSMS